MEALKQLIRDRWWPGRVGAGIAAAVAVLGVLESFIIEAEHPWLLAGTALLSAAALFLRRIAPNVTFAATMVAVAIVANSHSDETTVFAVMGAVVAAANVGLRVPMPRLLLTPAVLAAFIGISTVFFDVPLGADDVIGVGTLYGGALAGGAAFRHRLQQGEAAEARARQAEVERDQRAKEAAEAERARIARELHDIVSHSISVIAVQTQAIGRQLGPENEREARDLREVETVARQAMAEMRRLLGVLRVSGEPADLAPQPGLGQLERLLAQTRDAGLPVSLEIEGEAGPLPPGVDLAAYRVIQEALTNTRKHAGAAEAQVRIRYGEREVDVVVEDNGAGLRRHAEAGFGLAGMRERVALYGGEVEAGPINGRGFRVAARIPVREAAIRD